MTAAEIAECLAIALSTVSAILRRMGLGKRGHLEGLEPHNRYEHHAALLHLGVKGARPHRPTPATFHRPTARDGEGHRLGARPCASMTPASSSEWWASWALGVEVERS
jgi:hypothetical protein